MRYTEILTETITLPPRKALQWGKIRLQEFDHLLAEAKFIADANREVAKEDHLQSSIETAVYNNLSDLPDAEDAVYDARYRMGEFARMMKLKDLREMMDSIITYNGGLRIVGSWLSVASHIEWEAVRVEKFEALLPYRNRFRQALVDASVISDEYQTPEWNRRAALWADAFERFLVAVVQAKTLITTCQEKFQARLDYNQDLYDYEHHGGRSHRPERHGKVETLYHASAWATEIARDGFAAEPPDERRGIGSGRQVQDSISFTYDMELARQIVRTLREFIMISRGDLKAGTILRWMREDGVKYDANDLYYTASIKPGADYTNPEVVVRLFNYYLHQSPKRINPFFSNETNTLRALKGRSERDVGIIAAEVDLTQAVEWLPQEFEYRVPSSAVQSFKRVL